MGSHCSFGHVKTQVMAKRRAENQPSLTPNQKKSKIDLIYLFVDGVRHTVGKISTRATTLLKTMPRFKVYSQSYGAPKSWESWLARFRDSHSRVLEKKSHLNVGPMERFIVYYKGECHNPTLRKVWRWNSHSQKWELGILWDSQNFKAQL